MSVGAPPASVSQQTTTTLIRGSCTIWEIGLKTCTPLHLARGLEQFHLKTSRRTKPWVVSNWNYHGIQATDIQTVVLYEASKEGVSKCDEITDPNCSGTGWDYNLCTQSPQAHFVWFAITNWANYFNKLYEAFASSTISLTSLTSDLVSQFYTPQEDPSNLILPVSVVSGLAAALSVAWPPAAIAAGAGSVINGALTQAGLDKPEYVWTAGPWRELMLRSFAVPLFNGVKFKPPSAQPIPRYRRHWRRTMITR